MPLLAVQPSLPTLSVPRHGSGFIHPLLVRRSHSRFGSPLRAPSCLAAISLSLSGISFFVNTFSQKVSIAFHFSLESIVSLTTDLKDRSCPTTVSMSVSADPEIITVLGGGGAGLILAAFDFVFAVALFTLLPITCANVSSSAGWVAASASLADVHRESLFFLLSAFLLFFFSFLSLAAVPS